MNGLNSQQVCDVVIVDDNVLTLELVRRLLRNIDCNVQYFSNELRALSYLENHATRVLIVDHRMPRLDGLELLKRLFEVNEIGAARVYLCSAAELPEHVHAEAKHIGAEVLPKNVLRDRKRFLRLLSEF